MVTAVLALALASWRFTGDDLPHAAYLTVLDVLAIDDRATDAPTARKVLQLPTVVGDVTQEGVLEAAKIRRAHALLAR